MKQPRRFLIVLASSIVALAILAYVFITQLSPFDNAETGGIASETVNPVASNTGIEEPSSNNTTENEIEPETDPPTQLNIETEDRTMIQQGMKLYMKSSGQYLWQS